MSDKTKQLGQVYTPAWIVSEILNACAYTGESILQKYALDPACGDGRFLSQMVERYIDAGQAKALRPTQIASELEMYIVGIEIDKTAHEQCLTNLNHIVHDRLGIDTLNWQIHHADTLTQYQNYAKSFDWILGNPPYVRLHHLDTGTRQLLKEQFQFTKGTTDLYLAFFEMAFFMLKPTGKLGFITPNSFLHNTSYRAFRAFLKQQRTLSTLYDLKSNKVFDGFSTYTAISIFDNQQSYEHFIYKELTDNQFTTVNHICFDELGDSKWTFSNQQDEQFLKSIRNQPHQLQDFFNVQYGFATLRDKIFIAKVAPQDDSTCTFHGYPIEKSILKPIVKGSRYKGDDSSIEHIIFPYYHHNGRYVAYDESTLAKQFPLAYAYLLTHKDELLKRDLDKNAQWFEFGRSQGIQSSHQDKIVVSPLVNGQVHFYPLPFDVLVYSGMFITKKHDDIDWQLATNALGSSEFLQYARLTGKDMSGGYKSLSTKQIRTYGVLYDE